MMVDARRVLGCNLERWKHEACLRWWLRHTGLSCQMRRVVEGYLVDGIMVLI